MFTTNCFTCLLVCGLWGLMKVDGHSWLACTDYAEKNAGTWDPSKCRGFPRMAHARVNKNVAFGAETGYAHTPSETRPCNFLFTEDAYTRDHPLAIYYPGQQVVLVHPMKSHGSDAECTGTRVPDFGSNLYAVRAQKESQPSDPPFSQFLKRKIFDLGISPFGDDFNGNPSLSSIYPKPGFTNAPNFCANSNRAVATYSFNLPRRLKPGLYTFMWTWAFRSERDLYSTCFEARVAPTKRRRNARLQMRKVKDLTEPCGGITSNPGVLGNSNRGCTRSPQNGPRRYRVVSSKN